MNPDEDKPVVATASGGSLSSKDVKEKVADYATKMEGEVQKRLKDFSKMGILRRIWDSKVPDDDKRFYYFFTFKPTNREEVLEEIQKYLDFYKKLKFGMDSVRGSSEPRQNGEEPDIHELILAANEQLAKLHKAAKLGLDCTGSSSVYNLHKEFVAKHDKLQSLIVGVESEALKEDLKVTYDCEKSLVDIKTLSENLNNTEKKFDQMCQRFEQLVVVNERLQEKLTRVMERNEMLAQQQEQLMKENATIRSILVLYANNGHKIIPEQ